MFGFLEGRHHDTFMLSVSGLHNKLLQFNAPDGSSYVLYGDPAYGLSKNVLSLFWSAQLTHQEQVFNTAISGVRISVEWRFGKIV